MGLHHAAPSLLTGSVWVCNAIGLLDGFRQSHLSIKNPYTLNCASKQQLLPPRRCLRHLPSKGAAAASPASWIPRKPHTRRHSAGLCRTATAANTWAAGVPARVSWGAAVWV